MRAERGFTLLEVLVAMSIFAIIGLGATQMLRTMIKTHERVQAQVEAFNQVSAALQIMTRDLGQLVNRGVRDVYGDPLPALMVGTGAYPLEFTRTGWNNPARRPRSDLQRLAYSVDAEGNLVRHFWLVLDRAEDAEPITQLLLPEVQELRVQLLDEEGQVSNSWPVSDAPAALPTGVEVLLVTARHGEFRRLVPLVAAVQPLAVATADTPDSDATDSDATDTDGAETDSDEADTTPDDDASTQVIPRPDASGTRQ